MNSWATYSNQRLIFHPEGDALQEVFRLPARLSVVAPRSKRHDHAPHLDALQNLRQ
jgi:hypothetical protein